MAKLNIKSLFANIFKINIVNNSHSLVNNDKKFYYSTGFEEITTENFPKLFYEKNFERYNEEDKINILQEYIQRFIKENNISNISQIPKIEIINPWEEDPMAEIKMDYKIEINNGNVIFNSLLLNDPMFLFAELPAKIIELQQIEKANDTTLEPNLYKLQLEKQECEFSTKAIYDNTRIKPLKGMGSTYINEPQDKDNFIYCIHKLQLVERERQIARETAIKLLENCIQKDQYATRFDYMGLEDVKERIGSYKRCRQIYMEHTGIQNPEEQIDKLLLNILIDSQTMHKNDILDFELKMAMHFSYNQEDDFTCIDEYIEKYGEYTFTPQKLLEMSNQDINRLFYPQNWDKLSLKEKKWILEEQFRREIEILKIKNTEIPLYFKYLDERTSGEYSFNNKDICINLHIIDNKLENNSLTVFTTIPHELKHAKYYEDNNFNLILYIPQSKLTPNIITPNQFHSKEIKPILLDSNIPIRIKFETLDKDKLEKLFSNKNINYKRLRDESEILERLQPMEVVAYKYEDEKLYEIYYQMKEDGMITSDAQKHFDNYLNIVKQYEEIAKNIYGCDNPILSIEEYQLYILGERENYNPETKELDFALRYQTILNSLFYSNDVYIIDPRTSILERENGIFVKRKKEPIEKTMADEQNPSQYVYASELIYQKDLRHCVIHTSNDILNSISPQELLYLTGLLDYKEELSERTQKNGISSENSNPHIEEPYDDIQEAQDTLFLDEEESEL